MKKIIGVFLIIILSISFCYAQPESMISLSETSGSLPDGIELQLGNNPLYQKFSWKNDNSNNLRNIFSQDYILNFTLRPNADDSIELQGIIASDMGIAERNMLGFYDEEDFSNKQFLVDQQFTYTQGDVSAGIHFFDIPEEMVFSSNLRQQLTERYNERKIENILDWQQMEYTINLGQEDTDHLFLSYMTGEKQEKEIAGHGIELSYNLFGELPINYIDAYHQDNNKIISRDLLSLERQFGDFSVDFIQSENYIMPINSNQPSIAEDIDRLVLSGSFNFGTISYIDSYHRTLEKRREVSDSEVGWKADLEFDALSFDYSNMQTKHTDSKKNQDILKDITTLQLTYDRLETDRYLLSYTNRDGIITSSGHSSVVDEDRYKIVYMINSDQKLSFDYIDANHMNQYSFHLSPMIRYWPIGIAYVNRNSETGKDMNRLALTFPKKDIGFMNVDASYMLQNFFASGGSENKQDIQVNTEMGEVSVAAKKQKDETKNKSLESLTLGWRGDSTHAGWFYNRKNDNGDNWSLEFGRQFGDSISTDYEMHKNRNLQEHNFAFNWDIIENMNFNTNLNLRDEELDSRNYRFDAKFSDEIDLAMEYFLNPINKKRQVQEGECYRLYLNHDFSDDLGIQYLRSNMSFDSQGNLLPTEEEGVRLLFDWASLKSEVAYIQSIDKRLHDKSRMEYIVSGNLGNWGNLSLKLLDYKEESNFFDISLKHKGDNDTLSFHAISNPPDIEDVDYGEEYQTYQYYLEYDLKF
jgi:hypothetical protein